MTFTGLRRDQWTLLIGATTAAILFVGSVIAVSCCCKRRKISYEKGSFSFSKIYKSISHSFFRQIFIFYIMQLIGLF